MAVLETSISKEGTTPIRRSYYARTLCIIGIILSSYALYVEHRTSHQENEEEEFVALCDIEVIGASCR